MSSGAHGSSEEDEMAIGPVEYLIVAFPGNQLSGDLVPALEELVKTETVRILDIAFVEKDGNGDVAAFELEDFDSDAGRAFQRLQAEIGDLVNSDDLAAGCDRRSARVRRNNQGRELRCRRSDAEDQACTSWVQRPRPPSSREPPPPCPGACAAANSSEPCRISRPWRLSKPQPLRHPRPPNPHTSRSCRSSVSFESRVC